MTEEPPFIGVGADVSAKFKGAFCEARVKSTKKLIKCKVLMKNGTSCIVNDDQVEGALKLNGTVKVKQENDVQEATIIKLTDNSLYTVVFDDGDEKTLRRTSLCLKGERHFQEDETLDHRPLNNPENFGAPVSKQAKEEKTRKRTRSCSQNSDVEGDDEDSKHLSKKKRDSSFGKVVCVELGERRKSWFPALCIRKHMAEGLEVSKGQLLVQSFKDGRKLAINKTDIKEFCKEKEPVLSYMKGETKIDPILRGSIEKALAFFDNGELPRGWNIDLNDTTETSSSEDEDVMKEEAISPEEEEFLRKLYKIMDEQGTPISKPPALGCREIDLFKLYVTVTKHGGMDEVTNLNKWRNIYKEMGMTNPPSTAAYNIRNFYKRYIFPYEALEKGIDLSPDKKTNDKEKPKEPAKEKENAKEKDKCKKPESDSENENNAVRRLTRMQSKNESDSEVERRETRSSRPRRNSVEKQFNLQESKGNKQMASPIDSSDESLESYQEMNSYSRRGEMELDSDVTKQSEGDELVDIVNSPHSSVVSEDKEFSDTKSESELTMTEDGKYPIGARILVKYGKGKLHRAYEAKIIDVDSELTPDLLYYVHYRGWNHRYDEWIKHEFIEGLSPYPPKKKGTASKGAKGSSSGGYKNHSEPPGIHNFHQTHQPTPRTTARSRKAGSPPPLNPGTPPSNPHEKSTKTTQSTQKTTNTPAKQPVQSAKPTAVNPKPSITPLKGSQPKSSAPNPKPNFGAQKIDSPFADMKPHPVKPRTTRNSMQDVFLITALEESISESPASDVTGSGRPRRGREKQSQSPEREEESESSSAKEDDVDVQDKGRTPPQRKTTRRRRNERSPFGKQESKDSAEDEESVSEYSIDLWSDERNDGRNSKGDNKRKAVDSKKKDRPKSGKGKAASAKSIAFENDLKDLSKNVERQSSAMEILTDCALMKNDRQLLQNSEGGDEIMKDESIKTEEGFEEEEKNRRGSKRRNDGKVLKDRRPVKIETEGDGVATKSLKEIAVSEKVEQSKNEKKTSDKENMDETNDNIDDKKLKVENNNIDDSEMDNSNGLTCMEHVVDILQRAAAIDAEKQRKMKEVNSSPIRNKHDQRSEMVSPSVSLSTPERDRRKKRRERKRRRRAASCSVADASESENNQQSPFRRGKDKRHSTSEFEKEKFDFVSDLGK
eukprot:gene2773-996_t